MESIAKLVVVSVLSLLSFSVFAFGNDDVLKLLAAGFGEDVVLSAISAANPATFDTSAKGLIALKKAGVSTAIIRGIIARQGANNPTSQAAPRSGEDCQIEAPGMGYLLPMRASGKIIGLKPETPERSTDINGGSVIANIFTLGIAEVKGGTSLKIPGNRAPIRITDRTPEFLDLFFPPQSDPEKTSLLVHMTVNEHSRSVHLVSAAYSITGSHGHEDLGKGVLVPLTLEKVADLCLWEGKHYTHYKLKPSAPLTPGEYGFLINNKVFDFGVD